VVHTIVGIICMVLGILGIVFWWGPFGAVLRGLIPLLLLIAGLVASASGVFRKNQEETGPQPQPTGTEPK
jgi:hypothetical protein